MGGYCNTGRNGGYKVPSVKYHNEYGESKSNVMTKTNRTNRQRKSFKLGNKDLKDTDNYKYLGFIQNDTNNMEHLFTVMKGNVEAVHVY